MKYVLFFLILLLRFTFAQEYYPTVIGNEWFFDSSSTAFNTKVIADSTFPNGKKYAVLNSDDFAYGQYVRTDSQYVYYYHSSQQKDIPFFKLNGSIGDTTEAEYRQIIITGIDTITLFNEVTRVIQYRISDLTIRDISLSDKFGLISASLYSDPPPPWPDFVYKAVGCKINGTAYGFVLSVNPIESVPSEITLYQNYPNPFNPFTDIRYTVPENSDVVLKVYNTLGREIATLVNQKQSSGIHSVRFDATNVSSGMYYYRLITQRYADTKKMIVLK